MPRREKPDEGEVLRYDLCHIVLGRRFQQHKVGHAVTGGDMLLSADIWFSINDP